jgi:hypothetical protein
MKKFSARRSVAIVIGASVGLWATLGMTAVAAMGHF